MENQNIEFEIMRNAFEKNINRSFKIPLSRKIIYAIQGFGEFIIILFLIPFLTLIKIFEIIFNRK